MAQQVGVKRMRFSVCSVHSEYLPKHALILVGWTGKYWIVPRYIEKRYDYNALQNRADHLNAKLEKAGKLLPPF